MPKLIMLVGLPGSGKSTYRETFLVDHTDAVVISSDDYIDAQAATLGITYSQAFDRFVKEADKACRKAFAQAIKDGRDILIDRTNMSRRARSSWLNGVPKSYDCKAVVFCVPMGKLEARLRHREVITGKHIPKGVIESMAESYQTPSKDEGFSGVSYEYPDWAPWEAKNLKLDPAEIARIAHEVNRAYCASLGDDTQPAWKDAPTWQKRSTLDGVMFHTRNPNSLPSQSHENWLAEKERDGWSYGPVKDPDKKQHPCFVPYDELPQAQRSKDFIFSTIVKLLSGY